MTVIDSQTTRWCMGLKSVGLRDLLDEELQFLRGRAKLALLDLWQPAIVAAASPAVLYLSFLIIGDGPETAEPHVIVGFVLVFLGLLILPAISFLQFKDMVSDWRALRSDLEGRRVECFSSVTLRTPRFEDKTASDSPSPKSLEVLPKSRLVLLFNGAHPSHPMTVNIYEAVGPPESPAQYALPSELALKVPGELQQRATVERRRLTNAELDELGHHVKRLRRPPGSLVVLSIWFAMGLTAAVFSYQDGDFATWEGQYLLVFLGVGAAALWQVSRYIRTLLACGKIAKDRASGWVVVLEPKNADRARQEVLPGSGAVWSVDGKPSPWRFQKVSEKER